MLVSVAICTWNREKLLDQTLTQMRQLRIPDGVGWELLVVNNNCTDDTDAVLFRHADRLPLRRLFEAKQGHSHARNCAVAAAQGDLLLWTDDDVLVDREWLSEYVAAASRFPAATFFGGTVDPWFAAEPPRWISRHLHKITGVFAIRQLGEEVRPFTGNETPYGANMAFRLAAVKGIAFDPSLGRIGTGLLGADETDLIERLRQSGHHGVWVGTARVKHYIPAERLTKQYVWGICHGNSRVDFRRKPQPEGPTLWGAPRWAVRKYWESTVKAFLFSPFKGPRWLRAYLETAFFRGIIDASRNPARC
jgi:glycosyltransferase involved in cell wall biosynthesis